MSSSTLQTLLVALIVSVSAMLAARHVLPGPFRLLQTSIARAERVLARRRTLAAAA